MTNIIHPTNSDTDTDALTDSLTTLTVRVTELRVRNDFENYDINENILGEGNSVVILLYTSRVTEVKLLTRI